MIEVGAANFIDLLGWSRHKAVLVIGISCFIFGIPSALANTETLFGNWEMIYGRNFFKTIVLYCFFVDFANPWPNGCFFAGWFLDKEISRYRVRLRHKLQVAMASVALFYPMGGANRYYTHHSAAS